MVTSTHRTGLVRYRAAQVGTRTVIATMLALASSAIPQPAAAQIPDTFENLQVLSEDISRNELVATMRGFSLALGVRCAYCHPGGSGGSLQGVDFATDEDPDKEKARHMMRMVAELNESVLAELPGRDQPPFEVACVTCHHGLARPTTLEADLARTIERFGIDAAVERYAELRDEYFGSGAYDFGENSLNELAGSLAQADKLPEAIRILELNAEYFPESAQVAAGLGALHARSGEKEKAIAAYERALELQPNNRQVRRALEQLRGG